MHFIFNSRLPTVISADYPASGAPERDRRHRIDSESHATLQLYTESKIERVLKIYAKA